VSWQPASAWPVGLAHLFACSNRTSQCNVQVVRPQLAENVFWRCILLLYHTCALTTLFAPVCVLALVTHVTYFCDFIISGTTRGLRLLQYHPEPAPCLPAAKVEHSGQCLGRKCKLMNCMRLYFSIVLGLSSALEVPLPGLLQPESLSRKQGPKHRHHNYKCSTGPTYACVYNINLLQPTLCELGYKLVAHRQHARHNIPIIATCFSPRGASYTIRQLTAANRVVGDQSAARSGLEASQAAGQLSNPRQPA
jgi:hypothetical protein